MTSPVITIEEGQLKGKLSTDFLGGKYYSFLGIPYAKAPIGELRFKAPLPPESWEGILDATKEGPECPSKHTFFGFGIGSEDNCLNLNIFTKELNQNALKPVMFWLHGGGFFFGSNKIESYGPDYLITEDVVIICINYRLGALGFLSLEDSSLGVPGNAGLKDMVMALKWVQRNVQYFGGDPNNVTIFGESAGGASVHYLCLSPMAKGLFHKAIAQSGCALNSWARGCSNGRELARILGYKETDEKKILQYLQSLSHQQIVKAQHKPPDNFHAYGVRPFCPIIEKPSNEPAFLIEDPVEIIKSGRNNKVPMIMGYNSSEGLFFEVMRKIQKESRVHNLEQEVHHDLKASPEISKEIANKMERFYYGEKSYTENDVPTLVKLQGDTQFIHGIYRSINFHSQQEIPLYVYRMDLVTSINYFKLITTTKLLPLRFMLSLIAYLAGDGCIKRSILKMSDTIPCNSLEGTSHGDDVGYIFKNYFAKENITPGSIEYISIKRFIKMWTNFARTGNPTPDPNDELLNIIWEPLTETQKKYLRIGEKLKMIPNPDLPRMEFWDNIYKTYQ